MYTQTTYKKYIRSVSFVNTYIYTHTYIQIFSSNIECVNAYILIYTHTYIQIFSSIPEQPCLSSCLQKISTYIHTYIHVYMQTQKLEANKEALEGKIATYIHAYIQKYIHVCIQTQK